MNKAKIKKKLVALPKAVGLSLDERKTIADVQQKLLDFTRIYGDEVFKHRQLEAVLHEQLTGIKREAQTVIQNIANSKGIDLQALQKLFEGKH